MSCSRTLHRFLLSYVRHSFSATHFPGHCFRLIPASAASRLLLSRFLTQKSWVPPIKQPLALEAGQGALISFLSHLNTVCSHREVREHRIDA